MSTRPKKPTPPKQENPVFCARIDAELISWLRALAERERRSVALQLTVILEDYRARQEPRRR